MFVFASMLFSRLNRKNSKHETSSCIKKLNYIVWSELAKFVIAET
jgi:hypothetical protein